MIETVIDARYETGISGTISTKTVRLFTCAKCGFGWDAIHDDVGHEGRYTCPECEPMLSHDGEQVINKK